jgi:signal transduction histidine kinase
VRNLFAGLRGTAALAALVAVLPLLVVALIVTSDGQQDSDYVVLGIAGAIAVGLAYWAADRLVIRSLALRAEEAERASAVRAQLVGALVRAAEDERERIAGEVHDDAIQAMVAVGIRLRMLGNRIEDPEQRELFDSLEQTVETTIQRVRALLFELRPPALDRTGLREVLEELLDETFGDDGVDWNLVTRYDAEPSDATRIVLYRIAQEALDNVRRHAQATRVEVVVEGHEPGITTRVTDNGIGFDLDEVAKTSGRLGLTSMRERAAITGGTFRIESAPGAGTVLEWWLP